MPNETIQQLRRQIDEKHQEAHRMVDRLEGYLSDTNGRSAPVNEAGVPGLIVLNGESNREILRGTG